MKIKKFALATIVLSMTSACNADEQESAFVSNCNGSQQPFTEEICSCIYDNVKDDFSEEQVIRISRLFEGNVPEGMASLRNSGNKSDMDIHDRFHSVEGAVESCFEKSG